MENKSAVAIYHQAPNGSENPEEKVKAKHCFSRVQEVLSCAQKNFSASLKEAETQTKTDSRGHARVCNSVLPLDLTSFTNNKLLIQSIHIEGSPSTIWYGDELDMGLFQTRSDGHIRKIDASLPSDQSKLRAFRALCLSQEEMQSCEDLTKVIEAANFPVHYFRLLLASEAQRVLVVRR
jgi:hypothetical protein